MSANQPTTIEDDIANINDPLVRTYLERLGRKAGRDDETYKKKRQILTKFDGWLAKNGEVESVTHVDTFDIEDFFAYLVSEGYAKNTGKSYYHMLHAFYGELLDKYANSDRYDINLTANPITAIDLSEFSFSSINGKGDDTIHYVTEEEVNLMVKHASAPKLRNGVLIDLLFQTGMRRGEVTHIDLDDIDLDTCTISVYGEKTDKTRTVKFQPSLRRKLKVWIKNERPLLRDDSDRLFITNRSPSLSPLRVNRIVRQAAENAGIQETVGTDRNGKPRYRITAHSLRHGHAHHALECGIDLKNIKDHLGHSDIQQTMRYLQTVESDTHRIYDERFTLSESE